MLFGDMLVKKYLKKTSFIREANEGKKWLDPVVF